MRKIRKKQIEQIRKKSSLTAKEEDYPRLEGRAAMCIPCELHQTEEEVQFIYDVEHTIPLTELRKDDALRQLLVLSNVFRLKDVRQQYEFSMEPENLYYDMQGKVYVLHKDVIPRDYSGRQEHFLEEYRALVGYVLQKRYSYADYLEGGQPLLSKQPFLKTIYEAESIDAVAVCLEERYDELQEQRQRENIEIRRKVNHRRNVAVVIQGIALVLLMGGLFYTYQVRLKEEASIVEAYGNYLVEDYVAVIDAGSELLLERLNSRQKYIMAVAYVKCENLTAQQKDNILAALLPEGDEKLLEYWISLGRFEVEEAENIAQQRSDDELLLYAYMKEKQKIEEDTEMDGTKKSEAVRAVQSKIDALAQQYMTEEEGDE